MSKPSSSTPSKPLRLPRLPVPPLHDTLDRYLISIEPFLLEDEVRGGPSFKNAMAKRRSLADEFERGIGSICQERLVGTCLLPSQLLECVLFVLIAYF